MEVNDVIWSPHNSTSFAAAMDDGRVELWDLKKKPLDPILVHYPRGLQGARAGKGADAGLAKSGSPEKSSS